VKKVQMDFGVVKAKPTTTRNSPPATASAKKGAAFNVAPTGLGPAVAAVGLAAAILL
jgi:xyloglucan-specific endo-beta-1,4-glucanase